MTKTSPYELTEAQHAALVKLTDARALHLFELADLIGDMNADGLEFLRRLGDPDHSELTKFLSKADKSTFEFLASVRPEEVEKLKDGVRLAVATQTVADAGKAAFRVGRWLILAAFSVIVFFQFVWDKIPVSFKGAAGK
jgi:hypothetical protein